MQLQSGTILQRGKYRIETVLGQGGFGITYLATQKIIVKDSIGEIETTIKVAIKEFFMKDLCNRELGTTYMSVPSFRSKEVAERYKQKFIKEAKNISLLKHPSIVKVLNIFEENGTAYYVMEFVEGGSMQDYINQNGALQETEALCYIHQIADALDYIHQHQMNHLDVKPGNILRHTNGRVVLIDFGLSKCYDENGNQTSTTPIGISPGYAPMEQYKKGGVGTFSPATDIYSLGATLYKLLTSNTPPDASDIVDEGLPELPDYISGQVKKAIRKAMEIRRIDRPQSIKEFMEILKPKSEETRIFTEVTEKQGNAPINHSKVLGKPVDLGLSVKWASYNVGATSLEDYGGLYGWGDPTGIKTLKNIEDYPNANPPADISNTPYDIVHCQYGEKWRLPTCKELIELHEKCIWEWTIYEGTSGYKVIGPNKNSIFLPASGYRNGPTEIDKQNNYGFYWSSTLKSKGNAYCLFFNNNNIHSSYHGCCYIGRSVRPVTE